MNVRYARQAVSDVLEIAEYVREKNPAAALDIESAIRTTIALLADFPMLGRHRPELDVRILGIPRYPYTAYYRIEGGEIWIVHIRDDRRTPLEPGEL